LITAAENSCRNDAQVEDKRSLRPGVPRSDSTAAILRECVIDEQINYLEYRQHAGTKQQTDEAAHLSCTNQRTRIKTVKR